MEAVENPLEIPEVVQKCEGDSVHLLSIDLPEFESNGITESVVESDGLPTVATETVAAQADSALRESFIDTNAQTTTALLQNTESNVASVTETTPNPNSEMASEAETNFETSKIMNIESTDIIVEEAEYDCEGNIIESSIKEVSENCHNETVTFKTEILVEKSVNEDDKMKEEHSETDNVLNELGKDIELSEALCSSDITETVEVENNNCNKQHVLNNEELLDILQGNDVGTSSNINDNSKNFDSKSLETKLALQQLSRLKSNRGRHTKLSDRIPRKSRDVIKSANKLSISTETGLENKGKFKKSTEPVLNSDMKQVKESKAIEIVHKKVRENKNLETPISMKNDNAQDAVVTSNEIVKKNIVNALVEDWEDDESAVTHVKSNINEGDLSSNTSEAIAPTEAINEFNEKCLPKTSIDLSTSLDNLNKSSEEVNASRRQSRVIKKKVIYDPDNPDTFTKAKTSGKSKDHSTDRDNQSLKKMKIDHNLIEDGSKSTVNKLAWKKPPPKSIKHHKRASEIDKLLMDEGAVNMIYQLTPEAPKGKKNVKTKAEFIKKIQSSTPDGKEMKFRERKKETIKIEEEAKKISSGKQRSSFSSSVKSPLPADDFETHSADDSIIYRRHSSSSYSSSCMTPRRMSDIENTQNNTDRANDTLDSVTNEFDNVETNQKVEIFNLDVAKAVIDKNDCLSLKEKLNSKLSLALTKRKREINLKSEKPLKHKKTSKGEEQTLKFKHLLLKFDNTLAEIYIKKIVMKQSIEALQELGQALEHINTKKDISTTLLISECGTLCSVLDLKPLLDSNMEKRTNYAYDLADTVRAVLCSVERHNKLVVCCVWGACGGAGLALAALSDVLLAGACATFAAPPHAPGAAALTAACKRYPSKLINDLLIFEKQMSAEEALQSGFVSRTLWPDGCVEQSRVIAAAIAAQPLQKVLLKKKLLRLNASDSTTFRSCLETERDLLVEYWTSVEGQEWLRDTVDAA